MIHVVKNMLGWRRKQRLNRKLFGGPPIGPQIEFDVVGVCVTCRPAVYHGRTADWESVNREMDDFKRRHFGHDVKVYNTARRIPAGFDDSACEAFNREHWAMGMRANTSVTLGERSSVAYTFTSINSLPTSASLLAGATTLKVTNSDLNIDWRVGGWIKTGTTPTTAKSIVIRAASAFDDAEDWPDVFAGTDATKTISGADVLPCIPEVKSTATNATSNFEYTFMPTGLKISFGDVCPTVHQLFVSHDTAVNLNATAAVLTYKGQYVVA